MSRPALTLAVLLPALAAACTRPKPAGPVRQLALTPEQHWTSAEEGPQAFAEVRTFTVDRRGRVYILDGQSQLVQVFGADGAYLRTLGRRGAGPGEFSGANGLALDHEDRLWVYDPGNSRVTVFDTSGQFLTSHQLTVNSYGWVWDGGIDPEGRLLNPVYVPDGDSGRSAIARIDLTAGRADTLPVPRCRVSPANIYRARRGMMMVPFATGAYYRIDDHGYTWCGDTREAAIHQFRLGDTVPFRQFGVAVEPAPVSPAARDSAQERLKQFAERFGGGEVDLSLIPATQPVLERVDLDDTGQLWMQIQDKLGYRMLVFDSAGQETAEARAPFQPARWLPVIIRNGLLYAVTRDSLDVPGITRFRIH